MSSNRPRNIPFDDAVDLADIGQADATLREVSTDGVLDWDRFDIVPFAALLPSIAVLDREEREDGLIDFRCRFVGENINAIAQQSLRGLLVRDFLIGNQAEEIVEEYAATLRDAVPRASTGNVSTSDMTRVRYLRFLYPVRTKTGIDRVLLIMLFAKEQAED